MDYESELDEEQRAWNYTWYEDEDSIKWQLQKPFFWRNWIRHFKGEIYVLSSQQTIPSPQCITALKLFEEHIKQLSEMERTKAIKLLQKSFKSIFKAIHKQSKMMWLTTGELMFVVSRFETLSDEYGFQRPEKAQEVKKFIQLRIQKEKEFEQFWEEHIRDPKAKFSKVDFRLFVSFVAVMKRASGSENWDKITKLSQAFIDFKNSSEYPKKFLRDFFKEYLRDQLGECLQRKEIQENTPVLAMCHFLSLGIAKGFPSPKSIEEMYVPRKVNKKDLTSFSIVGNYALSRGNVRRMKLKKYPMPVSVKFYEDDESDAIDLQSCLKAAEILVTLRNHPHVISMYGVVFDQDVPIGIVLECDEGSVSDETKRRHYQFNEIALQWISQAASALIFAHNNGIPHGDVKTANMLLFKNKTILKLANFSHKAEQNAMSDVRNLIAVLKEICDEKNLSSENYSETLVYDLTAFLQKLENISSSNLLTAESVYKEVDDFLATHSF